MDRIFAGRPDRRIDKRLRLSAEPARVFEAWTTDAGVRSFFAPGARIDLSVGGPYELHFDQEAPEGSRGSEGCAVLSFLPGRMLSFTWNAPPHLSEVRARRTWVVLLLNPDPGGGTLLELAHLGWGEGPQWDEALAYFESAWELVLARLAHSLDSGPLDWAAPYTPDRPRRG